MCIARLNDLDLTVVLGAVLETEHKTVEDRQIRGCSLVKNSCEFVDEVQMVKSLTSEKELKFSQGLNPLIADMHNKQVTTEMVMENSTEQHSDEGMECIDMECRNPASFPGLHDRRLSSSFKFNAFTDHVKEVDVIKEEDYVEDRSQASKVMGTCNLLPAVSTSMKLPNQLQNAETLGTIIGSQVDLSSSKGLMVSAGTDVTAERQQNCKGDQIDVKGVTSARDEITEKNSPETFAINANNKGQVVATGRQHQQEQIETPENVSHGNFSFDNSLQTLALDMHGHRWHGNTVDLEPPDFLYELQSIRELPDGFLRRNQYTSNSSTSQNAIGAGSQPQIGMGGCDVDAESRMSGRSIEERYLGTNSKVVPANVSNDSPWVDAFRRRIGAHGIDLKQSRSLGTAHRNSDNLAHHGLTAAMEHLPHHAAAFPDNSMKHISSNLADGIGHHSHWPSHANRDVWWETPIVGHHLPLDGGLDRVRDVLHALEMVKQKLQRSSLQMTFPNYHIGYEARRGPLMIQSGSPLDYPGYRGSLYYPAMVQPNYNFYTRTLQPPFSEHAPVPAPRALMPFARTRNNNTYKWDLARGDPLATQEDLLPMANAQRSSYLDRNWDTIGKDRR